MKKVIFRTIFIVGILSQLTACKMDWLKNYPQDNLLEEILEDSIQNETGWNIDLSPMSPENNQVSF